MSGSDFFRNVVNQRNLRKAFCTAQIIAGRTTGYAALATGVVIGDTASGMDALTSGRNYAALAKARRAAEQNTP